MITDKKCHFAPNFVMAAMILILKTRNKDIIKKYKKIG